MVMVKDSKGEERFSVSTAWHKTLMRCREKILNEDSMVLGIFWGAVGGGKSLKAQYAGVVVDPTLEDNIERVAFNKEEFIKAILDNRKKVVIGDEGIALFFSRGSMTKEGRLMAEIMAQCRQKNLCMFICVPEILSVDWLILKAATFVAYVWEDKKEINGRLVTIKGNMAFYPEITGDPFKTRIIHYLQTKKRNPYASIYRPEPYLIEPGNPMGEGFKEPWYPAGKEKYLEKKESILKKYEGKEEKKEERVHKIDYVMMDALIKDELKEKEIAEKCQCNVRTVARRKKVLIN